MVDFQNWIGRTQHRKAIIDHRQAELMAVTLDKPIPSHGAPLPACWHWSWFNDALPASQLGRDGHPKKGGFIPPLPLPRRMWAGGKIDFLSPIKIGSTIEKRSTIEKIEQKSGSSGDLFIVTINHQLSEGNTLCIDERQNLVYRADPDPNSPAPDYPTAPEGADQSVEFTTNSTLMFRYSALTFNGHRIHYDADYAREVEGYPGLVFHAPLTATMLCDLGAKASNTPPPKSFSYRATAPVFCDETISLNVKKTPSGAQLWAAKTDGTQAMSALITS